MLEGIDVILYKRTASGTDSFGMPIFIEEPVIIKNVLVAPVSDEDIINELSITGKRVVYQLAIPKGDTYEWTECKVEFFGQRWKVVGIPTEGIEKLIPLSWNKKVKVERYE